MKKMPTPDDMDGLTDEIITSLRYLMHWTRFWFWGCKRVVKSIRLRTEGLSEAILKKLQSYTMQRHEASQNGNKS